MTITCTYITHKNKPCILLAYPYHAPLNKTLKLLDFVKYSNTHKGWYIPQNKALLQQVIAATKGIASVNVEALKIAPAAAPPAYIKNISNPVIEKIIASVVAKLLLKGYSPNTQKSYVLHLKEYLNIITLKYKPEAVQPSTIEKYLLWRLHEKNNKEADTNSHINAIKFYYEQVLGNEKILFNLPRPQRPLKLPKVLGSGELTKLFNALTNKKHKAILFTAYSAGMRVSEVCKLKQRDIDSNRMQILIADAKGKKDRYVTLSPVLLDVLRQYILQAKPKPVLYLFEGQYPGEAYNARTAQKVFQNAKEKAGI
ncbi:MAG: tyrosine-type recombinase/integrase, partial [Flavobacterium sp.]|nr:tyrosine-type recombinase/integrase [Flavobacterium sp.]